MKNKTFTHYRRIYALLTALLFCTITYGQTVTKTSNPSTTTTVDGCGNYCSIAGLGTLNFTAADFTNGCVITDVNVVIRWAKTDGTCTAPGIGNSFHAETSFRIDGPMGTQVVLVQPNTYTGSATMSLITTTFDQSAGTMAGGATPTAGTWRPNNGNLNNFNGASGLGTWTLRAGDNAGGDPLCIDWWRITITTAADVTPPSLSCPAPVSVNTDGGACIASGVSLGTATHSDVCGSAISNNAPATYPVGNTTVTWTATDAYGNSTSCFQTVTVTDNELPTIACPGNVSVNTDPGQCTASGVALGTPTTGDNCGVASVTNNAPAIYPKGVTNVTWTVTDVNGNSNTCVQTVTVADNENPTIGCPATVFVNTDAGICMASGVSLGWPITNDNCSVASTVNDAPATYPVGNTTVTWTVTDGDGNTATCTQTVTVTDNQNPTMVCNSYTAQLDAAGNVTITPGDVDGGSSDNCGIASSSVVPNTFNCSDIGTQSVTLSITDVNGNSNTCLSTVTVEDNVPPTAICQDITRTLDPTGNLIITASEVNNGSNDACGISSMSVSPSAFTCADMGNTTVTLTVWDNHGNMSTCTATLTIVPLAATATATDANCGNDGSVDVTVTGGTMPYTYWWSNGSTDEDPSGLAAGTYTVTVTDNSTCTTTAEATVNPGSPMGGIATTTSCGAVVCDIEDGAASLFVNGANEYLGSIQDLASGTGLGNTSFCVNIDGAPVACAGTFYLGRQWIVDVTNNEGAAVTFYFTQAEIDALAVATGYASAALMVPDLNVTAFDGGAETCADYTSNTLYGGLSITPDNPVAGVWSLQFTTTGFSSFYLHPTPVPLPVDLLSFSGYNDGDVNHLDWRTASEENVSHFSVERSVDGQTFEVLGDDVAAAGNSSEARAYSYTDSRPVAGINYYRLKMEDLDGSYEYSQIIQVKTEARPVKLFPNPFGGELTLELNSAEAGDAQVEIYDISGKRLVAEAIAVQEGGSRHPLSVGELQTGVYLARVYLPGSSEAFIVRLVKY